MTLKGKTFVVLDALDECEGRGELLDFLAPLLTKITPGLKVITTSRKLKEFEDFFYQHLADNNQVSIQNEKVGCDIDAFIQGRLLLDRRLRRWINRPREQEEIKRRLMEKSAGM